AEELDEVEEVKEELDDVQEVPEPLVDITKDHEIPKNESLEHLEDGIGNGYTLPTAKNEAVPEIKQPEKPSIEKKPWWSWRSWFSAKSDENVELKPKPLS
ncbi:TPA: hypothetical protein DCQ44_00315, partial [Candidatus Taylorbacteria bacterium]|nr:hypothetical protein [Candidatus Taylorbacteria bacterium]